MAAQAAQITPIVGSDADLLLSAAWLHDIGYAPDLVQTGFHPLDGARYLRAIGCPQRLTALVAHHSCAWIEAGMRGLAGELEVKHDREKSTTADVLWYADLTTGPDGDRLSLGQRLAEIEKRYGTEHLVTAFIRQAFPEMLTAVRRTESRLVAGALEVNMNEKDLPSGFIDQVHSIADIQQHQNGYGSSMSPVLPSNLGHLDHPEGRYIYRDSNAYRDLAGG